MAVQYITYADKSNINVNANVPDVNKINDSDMNQIKSVGNNNGLILEGLQGTTLWTNPNPTSSFAAQPVSMSSGDYDIIEWFFNGGTTGTICFTRKAIKGLGVVCDNIVNLNNGASQPTGVRQRVITYTSDTSYSIGDCLTRDDGTTASVPVVDNTKLIPLKAVGYKIS